MALSRREFIKGISSASLVVLGGGVINLSAKDASEIRKKSRLRFVVASDGHFGQPGTDYKSFHDTLVARIIEFHNVHPLNFCVINGDLIHDDKSHLPAVKSYFDKLPTAYYVTKGNHDLVSDEGWREVWGMPVNHEVKIGTTSLLLATTSNEKGEYLSPDLSWMKARLEDNVESKNVFIFIHIPQAKWTKNGIETPAFFELLKPYKNIRGIFHGHEHDQDGIKIVDKLPFMFDSHIGGNWGTSYRGFRVVELTHDNSLLTYIMNPLQRINEASF